MTWEYREHTADLRVAFTASSLEELFTDAARLVRELVAGTGPAPRSEETRALNLDGETPAELLLVFLRELLFLFETERFVPGSLDIRHLDRTRLDATVGGEPFDPDRHETQPEIKAVTRHGLLAVERNGKWEAEVTLDL